MEINSEFQAKESEKEKIKQEGLNVLLHNRKKGVREDQRFAYSCPAEERYHDQFFWDSCFHAISLSLLAPEMAKEEMRTLLLAQRKDGHIPMQIVWKKATIPDLGFLLGGMGGLPGEWKSRLINPPVLAQAIEKIWQETQDQEFLDEVLPKAKAFYINIARRRDPDQDGLLSVVANIETGTDASPSFDPAFGIRSKRPNAPELGLKYLSLWAKNFILGHNERLIFGRDYFNVEDVFFNSIYVQGLESLSNLCQVVEDQDAYKFAQMAEKVKESLLKKCYDQESGLFFNLYSKEEKKAKVITFKSLTPLMLQLPKEISERLVREYLFSENHFLTPYPIPSVSRSEPSYAPDERLHGFKSLEFLWRGSTWINVNWFISKGLRRNGYEKEAQELERKTVNLVSNSGFHEHFNPETGEGMGPKYYGWTTLVVDMI